MAFTIRTSEPYKCLSHSPVSHRRLYTRSATSCDIRLVIRFLPRPFTLPSFNTSDSASNARYRVERPIFHSSASSSIVKCGCKKSGVIRQYNPAPDLSGKGQWKHAPGWTLSQLRRGLGLIASLLTKAAPGQQIH